MPLVGYYISKYMAYKAFLTLFMTDLKSEIKNDRMQVNFICYTFKVKKESPVKNNEACKVDLKEYHIFIHINSVE